jgi:glycerol-3-phosphate dehydrogenase
VKRKPVTLTAARFDLLVIGGGILGAGVARDAALRGMRVALIEQGDFASGTSSRSSKLIHGGLRYLEQYDFRLVAESCRERQIVKEMAPHLVKPCEFLFPVYAGDSRSLWKVLLGLAAYDWLAGRRNVGRHRVLRAKEVADGEPDLTRTGLCGAVAYHDCREDDARFCLDTILHAATLGAVCVNYCALTGFKMHNGLVDAAVVRDRLSGDEFEISARRFVNAAGPWMEHVTGLGNFDPRTVALSPTKGVHLVLPALTHDRAITLQSRRDGRILFVIPWNDCSLVGTTDTEWIGNPAEAHASAADVDYLLKEAQAFFPARGLRPTDIITTFAGVRSLLRSTAAAPSARTREHRIVQHGQNFISLAGGKYTTFRLIAEQAVDHFSAAPCRTAVTPLPPHRPASAGQLVAANPAVFESDIVHACDYETAMTVTDVMRRRTSLALSRHGTAATAEIVSRLMATQLGWSDEQRRRSLADYVAEWSANQP